MKALDLKLSKLMGNEKELVTLRASKVKLEKLCRSLAKDKNNSTDQKASSEDTAQSNQSTD